MKCPACEDAEKMRMTDPMYGIFIRRSELPDWLLQRAENAKKNAEDSSAPFDYTIGYYLAAELIEYLKS